MQLVHLGDCPRVEDAASTRQVSDEEARKVENVRPAAARRADGYSRPVGERERSQHIVDGAAVMAERARVAFVRVAEDSCGHAQRREDAIAEVVADGL